MVDILTLEPDLWVQRGLLRGGEIILENRVTDTVLTRSANQPRKARNIWANPLVTCQSYEGARKLA